MSVLVLEGIRKSYRQGFLLRKREVLRDLSFSLEQGEVFGFLGHNGAGKTTTIKIILGFLRPDAGRVTIFGSEEASRAARRRIGFLSEEQGLLGFLTGWEMLELAGRLSGLPSPTRRRRVAELLERVGLGDRGGQRVKTYSKGMKQRLALAVALVGDPDLLLLDEPYSGLDPVGRKELRDILLELKGQGKTVLMSSHVVQDVEAVCDRVGILKEGRIEKFLNLSDIYSRVEPVAELTASGVDGKLLCSTVSGTELVYERSGVVVVRCRGEELLRALVSAVYSYGGYVLELRRPRKNLEDYLIETLKGGRGGRASREAELVPTR